MSVVGSPSNATTSARSPGAMRPKWSCCRRIFAATLVHARSASTGRHAESHHRHRLAPVVAVAEDADIAAATDRHAGGARGAKGMFGFEHLRCRRRSRHVMVEILLGGFHRGQCRQVRDAVFAHALERRLAAAIAVFDGVHAGVDRHAHPGIGGAVRGHGTAGQMRGLDQCLQFRGGERRLRAAVAADAVVRVHLDPVGAMSGLFAHGPKHRIDAAGFLRAAGQVDVRAEAVRSGAVTGRRHDRPRRHEQARAGNHAFVDRALDRYIGVARALRAQVAQRGESGQQRVAGMLRGLERAVRLRLLQHLVVPRRFVIGMQEQMRMEVDEARDECRTGEGDGLRVARIDAVRRTDGDDGAAAHQHGPAGVGDVIGAVPYAIRTQQVIRAAGGTRWRHGQRQRAGEQPHPPGFHRRSSPGWHHSARR